MKNILQTGQCLCFDNKGQEIPCIGSGQDGEFRVGNPWPDPRFVCRGEVVQDKLTGLVWPRDANPGVFPLTWAEAFVQVGLLNVQRYCGYNDWRLPNRRELRSLMGYQAKKPALPEGYPFENVFLGWYWTSTTAAINHAYAWYVHLEGARMFYGGKKQEYLFWPVRGESPLPVTGQCSCYDSSGVEIHCPGTGQDGELQKGTPWPEPRFTARGDVVVDHLTDLVWAQTPDLSDKPVSWQQALDTVARLNERQFCGIDHWRLPSINELESLVDCSCHSPALPLNHPFSGLQEGYWSSTTSFFETDWAWVLYMHKGACGVGYKIDSTFFVWPVATLQSGRQAA